jgi:hypothetical protein
MSRVGFEPTFPVLERTKKFHVVDCAATVITSCFSIQKSTLFPKNDLCFVQFPQKKICNRDALLSSEVGTQFLNIICKNILLQRIYLSVNWIRRQPSEFCNPLEDRIRIYSSEETPFRGDGNKLIK